MQHLPKQNRRIALSTLLLTTSIGAIPAFAAVGPPTTPDLTSANDSGVSHTDNLTNVAQPIFSGKGIPLAAIKLFAGTTQVGFGVVTPSGQWNVAVNTKLKDGAHAISARETYLGVESTSSYPVNIVIDTVAPAVPATPDMTTQSDHGSSNSDNLTNTTTPTFRGSGKAGDFIDLLNVTSFSPVAIGSTAITASGQWERAVTKPFASGTLYHQVAAQARDAAGNISARSNPLTIHIDTDVPAAPGTPDLLTTDDSGVSNTDNITNVTSPTLTVKAEVDSQVEVRYLANKKLFGTASATGRGVATIKVAGPLSGGYLLYAVCIDKAGNQSLTSSFDNPLGLVVDNSAPSEPAMPMLDSDSDSGTLSDNITNDKTPTFAAFSSTVGSITITYSDGVTTHKATAQVQSTHLWKLTLPTLADGVYDVTATLSDVAGNSSVSPVEHFTIDTKAPAVPDEPKLYQGDYGVSDSDHITNNDYPDFYGMAEPSARIELYNGPSSNSANLIDTVKADWKGEWELKKKFYQGTPLQIAAVAVDAAGNRSAASTPLLGLIDLTVPVATIATPNGPFIQNFTGLSGLVSDPNTNGDASGVDKVTYVLVRSGGGVWSGKDWSADGNAQLPATVVGNTWSVPIGLPTTGANKLNQLQDGDYSLGIKSYDKAGNQGFHPWAYFTVDTVAPTSYLQTPSANAIVPTFPSVTGVAADYHGIAQVKVKLQRTRNGVTSYWNGSAFVVGNATVNATVTPGSALWNWDKQLPKASDLDAGVYTLTAYSYDSAGNVGTSASRSFTLSGVSARSNSSFAPSGGSS